MSMVKARWYAELGAPGAAIGVIAAALVGGMALLVGQPVAWALAGIVALGVPLALLGASYGVLIALGLAQPGVFTPVAVLWLVGFPLSRLLHETMTPVLLGGNPTPPDDVLTFLAFQALVSMGFSIGFVWLHERICPIWLAQIREYNPHAERVYARYRVHAKALWEARELKRAQRVAARAPRQGAPSGAAGRVRTRRSS
jgi:hypothetical protein